MTGNVRQEQVARPVLSILKGCIQTGQLHIGDLAQFSPVQDVSRQRMVTHQRRCEP